MTGQQTCELHPELLPMLDCPRFDGCSAPICPLDRGMEKRTGPFGKEPSCKLPKAQRAELGASLPWLGLWPREMAGLKQSEDGMSAQAAPE